MTESRDDKGALQRLAAEVRKQVGSSGELALEERGLRKIEELATELGGPKGIPMLQLRRDSPVRLRLQRSRRNAEMTVEWQRDIGAIVITGHYLGEQRFLHRYVWDPGEERWRRMDGVRGLYDELSESLAELLFPEARR